MGGRAAGERTLVVRTLRDQMVSGVERRLWVLFAAVGFVLLIATTNIALLLLFRGAGRAREFAVRRALGAGRGRLVGQLFAEGLTLGALGGLAGLLVARIGVGILVSLAPAELPRLEESGLDRAVLLFAIVLTAATSLTFGLLSAARTFAVDERSVGNATGASLLAASDRPRHRRMNALAAIELALTTVLLVGAGLLLRSFVSLVLVDQGFEPKGAVALQISLPAARYPNQDTRVAFHERLLDRLAHAPGVDVGGLATAMPNRQPTGRFAYSSDGLPAIEDPVNIPVAEVRMVSEQFFEAMGMRLLDGRTFRRADDAGSEPVIVISERLARQRFKDRNAVGRILYSHSGNRRVVGIVADVRPAAAFAPADGAAYIPMRQARAVFAWHAGMTAVVRGRDQAAMAATMRSLLLSLDSEMPPFNVRRLDDEVSRLVAGPRFSATAVGGFALVALVMATVGVYGVMAYAIAQRTHEIGVRMAVGATRRQIAALIMRSAGFVVSGGLAIGLLAAAWLARGLTGLLHEVTPADPATLGLVAVVLAASGLSAAYVPARRAARVDVLTTLREP
jgi:predicted permease